MAKIDMLLEMELGVTGGEEDGVNNEDVNPEVCLKAQGSGSRLD